MIKINLLETAKGKGKRGGGGGPSMPSIEMGDMGSPKLKIFIMVVLVGFLNAGYWYRLDHQGKAIAVKMDQAVRKNRELADVKAKFIERQTQADNYKRRVDVIDGLRANQTGPVNLLAMLGETINNTEAVWLTKMDDTGAQVNVEGTALSADAVANLIANLQKTGYFSTVEIKETYQDEQIKDMQAFQFTLTCGKKS
ncbi:MAG TPA: PilN domain-containing protein [Candidatus Sulfotelmatobacter sp.]|jgi:Tfp pilus assembly protein PilN|nr:PilN domain-containing protein [Candidatus Sulfotelmatobacter sp.]